MNRTGERHTCARILRAARHARARRMRGFTLVELMITIAVAAILVAIAVPTFKHVVATSKLTAAANSVVGALHVARAAAIKRNADAQFCSKADNGGSTLGTACGTQTGAVYVLTGTAANPVAVQVHSASSVAGGPQKLVSIVPLSFDPQGMAHALGDTAPFTGDVADICSTALDSNDYTHRIVYMTTGTIIEVQKKDGACP